MKVKIQYTVNLTDKERRIIRKYYGQEGMATREEIKTWFYDYGQSMNDDVFGKLDEEEDSEGKND